MFASPIRDLIGSPMGSGIAAKHAFDLEFLADPQRVREGIRVQLLVGRKDHACIVVLRVPPSTELSGSDHSWLFAPENPTSPFAHDLNKIAEMIGCPFFHLANYVRRLLESIPY